MTVDFVALAPHYVEHLAPIYAALSATERGAFYTTRLLRDYATTRGVFARAGSRQRLPEVLGRGRGPIVTAGYADLRLASGSGRDQIYLNHGAGFRYSGDFPGYSGSSSGRERVVLFLSPSQESAEWELRANPRASAVAIGCPKLDPWHRRAALGWTKRASGRPTVAISFHHDGGPVPEMRSALPHYRAWLSELAGVVDLIGHAHPKWAPAVGRIFESCGIRFEPKFDRVMEIADLYVCDTSSTIYEFASTDRPVVLLNAPWYRRGFTHEGNPRFWAHADVGLQCDSPASLPDVIGRALADAAEVKAARRRAVAAVYEVMDGTAAAAAARAITELLESGPGSRAASPRRRFAQERGSELAPAVDASFGIVITNRDRHHGIENCLESLARQLVKPEWVVIADLGSKPEARCALAWSARRHGMSYLRMEYGGRWNKGLAFNTAVRRMPSVPFVVQLDADMIAAPDLLEQARAWLGTHRAVAFLPRFTSRWMIPVRFGAPGAAYDEILRRSRPSMNAWAIGGCTVLPRDWLWANRGIDEAYTGWGMEDSDLWWRATTDLPGHVEAQSCKVLHQWHPRAAGSREGLAENKERLYRRLLGEPLPTNPGGWGEAVVSELVVRS